MSLDPKLLAMAVAGIDALNGISTMLGIIALFLFILTVTLLTQRK